MNGPTVLRVAKSSSVSGLAGAIAKFLREDGNRGKVVVQSIGNAALVKSIKAVALATQYMQSEAVDIVSFVSFFNAYDGRASATTSGGIVGIRLVVNIVHYVTVDLKTKLVTPESDSSEIKSDVK
jgi:stage V sporulation protein SpoVS